MSPYDGTGLPAFAAPPRRRRLPVAAVAVAMVTLTVGAVAGVLVGRVVFRTPRAATDRVDLAIFLEPRSAPDVEASVLELLRDDADVLAACMVGTDGAHREFTELFAATPASLRSVTPDDLPVSFRLDLDGDPAAIVRLMREFKVMPGVREVLTPDPSASRFTVECERFGSRVIG